MPATLSIITNVFPAGERGKAIGVWAATAGLACRARAAHGWLPPRAFLLGLGLPRERPDRDRRAPRRRVPHPDLEGPARLAARSGRRRPFDRRSDRAALRDHRGARARVGQHDDPCCVRGRAGAHRSLRRVGAPIRSPHARRPSLPQPALLGRQCGHHARLLRDSRSHLRLDPVFPVRARLHATADRRPLPPFGDRDDGRRTAEREARRARRHEDRRHRRAS